MHQSLSALRMPSHYCFAPCLPEIVKIRNAKACPFQCDIFSASGWAVESF